MNIAATIIGILIIAFVLLFAIFSTREVIETKKQIKEIEKREKEAKEDVQTIINHEEKSNEIKEEQTAKVKEINDAKTKEELIAIANGIADSNNDKLHKQRQKGK